MATKPQQPPPTRGNRFEYDDEAAIGITIERATDEEHVEQKQATAEAEREAPNSKP